MSHRIEKINHLIQEEVARLIQQDFREDFITVTVVETSPDLKNARVWISCFKKSNQILNKLSKKRSKYQSYLGRLLSMKNTPRISFFYDRGEEKVTRIEKILSDIKKKSP